MKIWKNKKLIPVWIWILTIIILFAVGIDRLWKSPISDNITLQYPNFIAENDESCAIIENSGKDIVLLNSNGEYLRKIHGEKLDSGFGIASELLLDTQNNLYVLDYVTDSNSKYVLQERILKFNAAGDFERVVYSLDSYPEDLRTKPKLNCIKMYQDNLYFIEVDYNSFYLKSIKGEQVCLEKQYQLEMALDTANDFDITNKFDINYTTMKGDIFNVDKGMIYDSRAMDTKDFYSIAWDLDSDTEGNLYFTDIGQRTIMKYDTNGKFSTVMQRGKMSDEKLSFNDTPICYNICILSDGRMATAYQENAMILSSDSNILYNNSTIPKEYSVYAMDLLAVVSAIIVGIGAVILIIKLLMIAIHTKFSATVKNIALVSVATIITMVMVMTMTIAYYNRSYNSEVSNKMTVVANLLGKTIDAEAFDNLKNPSDFFGDNYLHLKNTIDKFFIDNKDICSNMFCVMYKVDRNVISLVYQEDKIGTFYPYDWPYENSDEKYIYQSGDILRYEDLNNSEGVFKFVLGPIKNSQGEVIGLIEIGTDLTQFNKSTQAANMNIVLTVVSVITTILLLTTEMFNLLGIFQKRKATIASNAKAPVLVEFIRPIIFIVFFCTNMATSFLPVYAQSMEAMGLAPELAAAMTMSAEVFFGAIAGMLGGYLIDRIGVKKISVVGCVLFTIGLAYCGFTSNIYQLICANSIVGLGGGLILVAINTYIASFNSEERGLGFANFSAAYLSGLNCGVVVGSRLAENLGYKSVFVISGALSVIAVWFIVKYIKDIRHKKEITQTKISTLKFLLSPRVALYFICTQMPYIIASYFILYFFPLFAGNNNVSPSLVAQAFLLNGVIVIYLGPLLANLTTKYLTNLKSVVLSRAIYLVCFVLFVIKPSIVTCFIIAGIMGFADSFGFSSQAVYLTDLDEVSEYGEGKSLGVNSAFENIAQTVGPFIFAGAMVAGEQLGIMLLGICFGIMLLLFGVGTVLENKRRDKLKNEQQLSAKKIS